MKGPKPTSCSRCGGRIVRELWKADPRRQRGYYGICYLATATCENGHVVESKP